MTHTSPIKSDTKKIFRIPQTLTKISKKTLTNKKKNRTKKSSLVNVITK